MKDSKFGQRSNIPIPEGVFCKKCWLAMALAEPTTASGDAHLHCAAMEAARDFVKMGMQLCPSATPKDLRAQLYRLLEAAINERSEAAEGKAAIIQKAAVSLFGQRIDLADIMVHARAVQA